MSKQSTFTINKSPNKIGTVGDLSIEGNAHRAISLALDLKKGYAL